MTAQNPSPAGIDIIVRFANGGRLTTEDLSLIEAVRRQRSILAASRATGVSYRKCWLTVDALNRMFETPVFTTYPGRRGGGAELTAFGERLVALYRSMERRSRAASNQAMAELTASLNPLYQPKASAEASEGSPPRSHLLQWRRS
ncbi:LysR family transcriptional regulator [Microbacteriaceae bacterium K1510]|nr:LysR family transcriptional regulator [Microbacteriaceae bacterium K1510]